MTRASVRAPATGWSCATRSLVAVLSVIAVLASGPASAARLPSTKPAPDDVVATQLLPGALKRSLRAAAGREEGAPANLRDRLAAARRLIEVGRMNGDPRTLGYAEALLAPWPADAPDAPVDAVVLHATIAQSRHAFVRAVVLLDRVIAHTRADEPAHAQALLTRATVKQVTGHVAAARADCARLVPVARDVALICTASAGSVGGSLEASIPVLKIAAGRTAGPVRAWALAVLAQACEQRGDVTTAAAAYRDALAAADDLVTRLAYADLLLAQRESTEVRRVLADAPETDGVLLRRWRAARVLGDPDATAIEVRLRTRLEDAHARGDGSDLLHARDWAQFELERGDTTQALRLARANWETQREPADALVLARAALAARDPQSRIEIQTWMRATTLQDVRLSSLLEQP